MASGTIARENLVNEHEVLFCGRTAPDPTKTQICLLKAGASVSEPVDKATLIANELTIAGYSRTRFGNVVSNVSSNIITTAQPHNITEALPIFFATVSGGVALTGIDNGTKYYAKSVSNTTLQVAATSGGSALTISNGSGTNLVIPGVAYDSGDQRVESPLTKAVLTMAGDGQFQGVFVLLNGDNTNSYTVSSIDAGSDEITTSSSHGRTTGDEVVVSVDSGGTLPGGLATQIYYARAVDSDTVSLHPTAADAVADSAKVNITSSGSGSIRLRPANGIVYGFYVFATPQNFFNGQAITLELSLNRKVA